MTGCVEDGCRESLRRVYWLTRKADGFTTTYMPVDSWGFCPTHGPQER